MLRFMRAIDIDGEVWIYRSYADSIISLESLNSPEDFRGCAWPDIKECSPTWA